MKRVTGIGGIFFKAKDPKALGDWYDKHLGLTPGADGSVILPFREAEPPHRDAYAVWAPFQEATPYFAPSTQPFMVNYRVEDLEALLAELEQEGVTVLPDREDGAYGRFAWVLDPEGNKIELWEPPREA